MSEELVLDSRDLPILVPFIVLALVLAGGVNSAAGQTATALLHSDNQVPGAPDGHTIDTFGDTAVNRVGGYGVILYTRNGTDVRTHIWGNPTGDPGTLLHSEGLYGNLQQHRFGATFGMTDSGDVAYRAISDNVLTGAVNLNGVWIGDIAVAQENEQTLSFPNRLWSYLSVPDITVDGRPYFLGGLTDEPDGRVRTHGLFFGLDAAAVLKSGDTVPGLPHDLAWSFPVLRDFCFSSNGTHYLTQVKMKTESLADDNAVVLDGVGLEVAGSLVCETGSVPAAAGGIPNENWSEFRFTEVNESGSWLLTATTDGGRLRTRSEVLMRDGNIVLRNGDVVDGETLDGYFQAAQLNEDGDYAALWEQFAGRRQRLLLFNGRIILKEGDPVDLDRDGIVEPATEITHFTGINAMTLSDRDHTGTARIYFPARFDTADESFLPGFFRIELPEVKLFVTPETPVAGETLEVNAWGGIHGNFVALVAVSVDGMPTFTQIHTATFDSTGNFRFLPTVAPGFAGHTVGIQAWGRGSGGKYRPSNIVEVAF